MQHSTEPHNPLRWVHGADLAACLVLLTGCLIGAWLTWGRLYDPIVDQGWYMQVSARLLAGEILYRDMVWMYGPMPVYTLSQLFRWLGIHVSALFFLYQSLAVLGCLLTYAVARSLLSPFLAFLSTAALFLGGWWGGYLGFTQAYTGAVPMGAVMGLLFVVCMLSYLRSGRLFWLVGAGLVTGAATLIKPEFAVACAGTGLLVLGALALFPRAWIHSSDGRWRALGVYCLCTLIVAGPAYGSLVHRAGWREVWAGITGYDQDAILLGVWPPWGTSESWLTILSGLGILLVAAVVLSVLVAPGLLRKRPLPVGLSAGLGMLLAVLPWRSLALMNPRLVASMRSSVPALAEQGIRVLWAPGTVLLAVLAIALGILWIRSHRREQPLDDAQLSLVVLVLYSALAALRSFLHPTGTFHFLYLNTLMPVLVYLAAVALPGAIEGRWRPPVRASRARAFVVAAMLGYAAAGVVWDLDYYAQQTAHWVTPRGTALYNPNHLRRQAWPELLQYILAHTESGDPIAVLGQEPGFYFWTGRKNPLRQDTLLPGMESSAQDALEIVRRFQRHPPRLIAIPQGVTYGRGWFWDLDIGRQAYADLEPVWDYVSTHYRFRIILGGETWGYAVYEPQ